MTDNLRLWNAVAKTNPAHTKKVEFGRKFTSIDAHWQIMRATETFGPIGEGWGYSVQHSTITLAPEMILAIADVTIWWSGQDDDPGVKRGEYGPIRATCEMWSVERKFGKIVYEDDKPKMRADEDAPKKAMTDALTKGLSHLGFSADVFLGLFDDNRYVQKMQKEFAGQTDPIQSDADAMYAEQSADRRKQGLEPVRKPKPTRKEWAGYVVDDLLLSPFPSVEALDEWLTDPDREEKIKQLHEENHGLWLAIQDAAKDRRRDLQRGK